MDLLDLIATKEDAKIIVRKPSASGNAKQLPGNQHRKSWKAGERTATGRLKVRVLDTAAMIRLIDRVRSGDVDPTGFFWSRVDKTPGFGPWGNCWKWTGGLSKQTGYGNTMKVTGHRTLPHRLSYVMHHGPIPDDLEINHTCEVRSCVNPDHLEVKTHKDNMHFSRTLAAINIEKTHCPHGHPYDETNTHYTKAGGRVCRTCRDAKVRAFVKAAVAKDPQYHAKAKARAVAKKKAKQAA